LTPGLMVLAKSSSDTTSTTSSSESDSGDECCALSWATCETGVPKEHGPASEAVPLKIYNPIPWLRDLSEQFGWRLLVMLCASQHLLKGFVMHFVGQSTKYLYKSYGVPGPRMQILNSVSFLPWAMKPIIGLVSDAFPIAGLSKAPYVMAASVVGVCACAALGGIPQDYLVVEQAVGCCFLMQLQFSTCDLLAEAKYSERMQAKPKHGPELLTFVWFGIQLGGLVGVALGGVVLHYLNVKAIYLLAILPAVCILVPARANYLGETKMCSAEVAKARQKLTEEKEVCALCLVMFAGTIILTVLGIAFQSTLVNAIGALVVAAVMLVAFSLVLKPIIAKANAYFLLQNCLMFSTGGASFYFFTDDEKQYPEGPHFSEFFYISVLGVGGALCSLLGIVSYQRWLKNWTYRGLLLMTNLVYSFLCIIDLIMYKRLNVRLGIPDHFFVLSTGSMETVVQYWWWMPAVVILSQLCPKGMEATMYALLAGCSNLGSSISSNLGALLLEWLHVSPKAGPNESAQFDNLWVASAVSTALPLTTLVLLPWLIPDARQTDKLLEDDDRSATSGSLLKRWSSRDSSQTPLGTQLKMKMATLQSS